MSASRDPTIPEIGPTWHGYCDSTQDAMFLFEACLQGRLPHIPRRPQDREKDGIIRSGAIFIYEENASGIKRWTDGKNWSPSRILGNYLLYREVNDNIDPKDKKKAKKSRKGKHEFGEERSPAHSSPSSRRSSEGFPNGNASNDSSDSAPAVQPVAGQNSAERDVERNFIGSLTDTYSFKQGGLVKKTASVRINGVQHHLVSYYTLEDAKSGVLKRPSQDPQISRLELRHELVTFNWRAPITDSREFCFGPQPWGSSLFPNQLGVAGYLMQQQTFPMGQQVPQYQMPSQQSFPVFQQPEAQSNPRFNSQQLAARHSGNRSNRYEPYPSPALSLQRTASVPTTTEQQFSPATPAPINSMLQRRHSAIPPGPDQTFSPIAPSNLDSSSQQRSLMLQRSADAHYLPTTSTTLETIPQNAPVSLAHSSEQQYSPITPTTTNGMNHFGLYAPSTTVPDIKTEAFSQPHESVRHDSAYGSFSGAAPLMRDDGLRADSFQAPPQDPYGLYYERNSGVPEWSQYEHIPTYAGRSAI
ncbi:MAG: hypothetical protein M1822_005788 [Bathelium mastoideum]|nr:MAG: hypothetical protein M1822_005788 [Bathelium mastoideum]